MSESYWELWVQTYDTFGEHEPVVSERFANEDAAHLVCYYRNQGWGTRAWLEYVSDPEIDQSTVEDIKERFKEYTFYPKLTRADIDAIVKGEKR